MKTSNGAAHFIRLRSNCDLEFIFCPALRQRWQSCTWQRRSRLFFGLTSLVWVVGQLAGPRLVETLTASCSGKHLRQRRLLSCHFDSWLPLRHHLGDRPRFLALLESTCHSALPDAVTTETGPFTQTKKWGSFELKFDNELISATTQLNRPSSSPWLARACGNETNILVDELYSLLTLKDSVDSACVRMPSHVMPCLFSASLPTAIARFFAGLENGLNIWEFLPFSLVSRCCTLQFYPLHSAVAPTMVFQEYSIGATGAWFSYNQCCKTINAVVFCFFVSSEYVSKWIKKVHNYFVNMLKKKNLSLIHICFALLVGLRKTFNLNIKG